MIDNESNSQFDNLYRELLIYKRAYSIACEFIYNLYLSTTDEEETYLWNLFTAGLEKSTFIVDFESFILHKARFLDKGDNK